MTLIVGYAPDERGGAALSLAAMLARSAGDDVVVGCVVPAPWVPGMARIDADYRKELDSTADRALERARTNLPTDIKATFVRHSARSGPAGLLDLAKQHGADMVVLGSSSAGVFGHVALGSVTTRLLHSSTVPVALATRGFRAKPDGRVSRVTAAYGGGSGGSESLVVAAATVAAHVGAALRIGSFAVWSRPEYTTTLGTGSEDPVMNEWVASVRSTTNAVLAHVEELATVPHDIETVIGRGSSWAEALEDISWGDGDVLVVGSSDLGPFSQVFLGSRATKIVRHSPVPVVVAPRASAEQLADWAARG
jgi:nucleotide-binding universal stress UspA family protein